MLEGVNDLEADLLFDVLHPANVGEGDHGAVRVDPLAGRREGRLLFAPLRGRRFRRDEQIRKLWLGELRIGGDRSAVGIPCPVEIALVQ